MSVLSAQQIAILRAELAQPAYAGLPAAQSWERLHAPTVQPNPEPAPLVPVAPDATEVLVSISPESLVRAAGYAGPWADMARHFDTSNIAALQRDALIFARLGAITAEELAVVQQVLARQQPDPDWPATIAGPSPIQRLLPGLLLTLQGPSGPYQVDYVPYHVLLFEVITGG